MGSLHDKSISELLALYVAVMEELRERDVLRSANNPTGDFAEYLFCRAFGWTQEDLPILIATSSCCRTTYGTLPASST
jgi:hypothetical protein